MKKGILLALAMGLSSGLGAANSSERMATGLEMRELAQKETQTPPQRTPQATPAKGRRAIEKETEGFLHSRSRHSTGDLEGTIKDLGNEELLQLWEKIEKYFKKPWYALYKESKFAKAVNELNIAYKPTEKISASDIKELKSLVDAEVESRELDTEALSTEASSEEEGSQESVSKKLDFSDDMSVASQSPVDVSELSQEQLENIDALITEYTKSSAWFPASTLGKKINALGIDGVRLGEHTWNALSKPQIMGLRAAVQNRLAQLAAGDDDNSEGPAETNSFLSDEGGDAGNEGTNSRAASPALSVAASEEPAGNNSRAQSPEPAASSEVNVDALVADTNSPIAALADAQAPTHASKTPEKAKTGFSGKQYLATAGGAGALAALLMSPELKSGKNPLKSLIALLPFLTPARVKTLSRTQKMALGRLVTAAIIGGAGVGSASIGAYKMYKEHKATKAA